MLNAYQLRLKYKNKYRLKVASFFLTPCILFKNNDVQTKGDGEMNLAEHNYSRKLYFDSL